MGDNIMPYKTGSWGQQAKLRCKRRKQYFKEYQKKRYNETYEEYLERERKYLQRRKTPNEKLKGARERQRKYIKRNPKKIKARNLALYHTKIPKGQICEACNKKPATERHHPDYSKPLEVKFLCASCNRGSDHY